MNGTRKKCVIQVLEHLVGFVICRLVLGRAVKSCRRVGSHVDEERLLKSVSLSNSRHSHKRVKP